MTPAHVGRSTPQRLAASEQPLCKAYDLAILDLDGVVYVSGRPITEAPEHLQRALAAGMRLGYVTNNASRPPEEVAASLAAMGLRSTTASDVVTSAQAVVRLLVDDLPFGARVLVVGGAGLMAALAEAGLTAVFSADDEPAAVVQGFSPDVSWRELYEGGLAVQRGVPWYASNIDSTIPTARGLAPGNGTLVDAVRQASGGEPVVAGKPEPALFTETVRRLGARRPLVVGDRLDTDILGANRFGADSLLVLTGVTDLSALLNAIPEHRPSYVDENLGGLLASQTEISYRPDGAGCGGFTAQLDGDGVPRLTGRGEPRDALRAIVAAAWAHRDAGGRPLDTNLITDRLVSTGWRAEAASVSRRDHTRR